MPWLVRIPTAYRFLIMACPAAPDALLSTFVSTFFLTAPIRPMWSNKAGPGLPVIGRWRSGLNSPPPQCPFILRKCARLFLNYLGENSALIRAGTRVPPDCGIVLFQNLFAAAVSAAPQRQNAESFYLSSAIQRGGE